MAKIGFTTGRLPDQHRKRILTVVGFIALVVTTSTTPEFNFAFFVGVTGCLCLLLAAKPIHQNKHSHNSQDRIALLSESSNRKLGCMNDTSKSETTSASNLSHSCQTSSHSHARFTDGIEVVTKNRRQANSLVGKPSNSNINKSETMASIFLRENLMNAKTRICAAGVSLPFVNDLAKTDSELKRFAKRLHEQPALSIQLIVCNPLAPALAMRKGSRYKPMESPPRKAAAETLICVFDWKEQFHLDIPTLEVRIVNHLLPYGMLLIDDTITWNPTAITLPGSQMPGIVQPSDSKIGGALFQDFISVWSDSRKCLRFERRPTATDLLDFMDDDKTLKLPNRDTIAFVRSILESR